MCEGEADGGGERRGADGCEDEATRDASHDCLLRSFRNYVLHGPTPPMRSTAMCITWPGGGSSIGGNLISGPEVDAGKPLQELRRSARLESRTTVDDEVLLEAGRLHDGALDRERDTRVAGDVAELPLREAEMPGDDLVALEPDPDAGHLRRAVPVERDQVRERAGLDQLTCALRQLHDAKRAPTRPRRGKR